MSKKFNKILLSLPILTLATTPLITLTSKAPRNSSRAIDKDFNSFEAQAKAEAEKLIKEAIESLVKFLEELDEKIKKEALNNPSQLSRRLYVQKLAAYYKTNKDNIIANPKTYGFSFTALEQISKYKKIILARVEYEGKTYENVKIGDTEFDSYKAELEAKGAKVTKIKEVENQITKARFTLFLKKYVDGLKQQITNLVYSENQIPDLKPSVSFEWDETTQTFKPKLNILDKPEGFDSWDDYIKKNITKKIADYDLKQSQDANIAEDKLEELEKIPLVPGDKPKPIDKDDIDSLPELEALVKSEYANKTSNELQALSKEELKKAFFFNNPVNSRYEYTVESITREDNKIYANVVISDRVAPERKRTYSKSEIKVDNSTSYALNQLLYEAQNQEISKVMTEFYQALGLDDKIDYNSLANDNLQQTLYAMVELATKIVTLDSPDTKEFKAERQALIDRKIKDIQANRLSKTAAIVEIKSAIRDTLLSYLVSAQITIKYTFKVGDEERSVNETNPYWKVMGRAYERIMNQFAKAITTYKDIIEKNLQVNSSKQRKLEKRVIEELYEALRKDIFRLKSIASQHPNNLEKWYAHYVESLKRVKKEFDTLRDLATNKEINESSKAEDKKTYLDSYLAAQEHISKQHVSQNKLRTVIGAILLSLGLLMLIISLIMLLVKFKVNKRRKVILAYSVMIGVSAILVVAGVILLALVI
ncbi:Uncharacterised protein [Metamycoplasma arthritidis]|uniref:Transmembrane protein n=1 Tax=Metamycoplasma arthritidis (strain 158L3-1) TaxID=243272 RepID=B3PMA8_META1|nr:hypothetical protein [Metamycoplasma arthritidis]ACF07160.1 conserved hypothetical protein [Metamycoplasma arthritidis 158L3-1]VEU78685.1 Uncharacterised protein [Metamycoplasma arthritidis]